MFELSYLYAKRFVLVRTMRALYGLACGLQAVNSRLRGHVPQDLRLRPWSHYHN